MTPDVIEAVLLWEDPWLTGRIMGVGLYLLICLRQLSFGRQEAAESCRVVAS